MTETISNTITTGVTLSIAHQNPLVISTTGNVSTQYPYGSDGILGLAGTAWTITNHGTVSSNYDAIYLMDGGTISSNGSIKGGSYSFAAVLTNGAPATVYNHGLVSAYSNGVLLKDGGAVNNFLQGRIAATGGGGPSYYGVKVDGAGYVGNAGSITGYHFGVMLTGGGTVNNSGRITGTAGMQVAYPNIGVGVYFGGAGTVTNSGTISGLLYSVQFDTTQTARLVETADAALLGRVKGGSGSNTLELAESTAGRTGTITSVATAFTNFQTLDIDGGASWLVDTLGGFANGGTIAFVGAGATIAFGDTLIAPATLLGFVPSETIDFVNLPFVAGDTAQLLTGNTLEIDLVDGGSFDLDLDPNQNFTNQLFHLASVGNTTILTTDNAPCYCRGTHIRTPSGDVTVETLGIGDLVLTASGATRPVKWIGTRFYEGRFAENNPAALPIRIAAGALGHHLPGRDLLVSPEHALLLDGLLVPARLLCNGRGIAQLHSVQRIDYFHVELDSHDILLAEGVPAESFVDCDSRAMFHNADEFARLYPGAAPPIWQFCAERLDEASPALERLRRRLNGTGLTPLGTLDGKLDECTRTRVRGWASDHPGNPADARRVILRVLCDGVPVARAVAARPRADLARLGLGDCAFEIAFCPPLDPTRSHLIRVLRDEDAAELEGSPVTMEPALTLDEPMQARLARHIADAADHPALLDGMITWLVAQTEGLLQARAEQGGAPADAASLRTRWGQLPPPVCARPSAEVSLRPCALMLDDRLPMVGDNGGAAAVLDHAAALIRLGFDVSFTPVQETTPTDTQALDALGVRVLGAPWYASVEEVLRRHAGRFALIYLHRAGNAAAYGRLARHYFPQAQLVYSVADLHHVRLARQAEIENRPELHEMARRLAAEETLAAWRADAVITHSQDEAERLRRAVPGVAVHVVPWSIPERPRPAAFASRAGLAFVGSFAHEPNVDAVHYLAEAILPLVLQRLPQVECLLVGGPVPPSVRRLAQPGLRVLGHVDDLNLVFAKLRLTIAPLRFGAGLKGKVLESFAAGLPCIGTPIAFEGMGLPPTLDACRAEGPAALAEAIIRAHEDEVVNIALATAAQHFAATCFSASHIDLLLQPVVAPALRCWAGQERRATA